MARGDNQSRIQSERNAQINSVVGSGLTLIGGAIIGGLPGLALAGGLRFTKWHNSQSISAYKIS